VSVRLSVYPCVHPSATRRHCTKTAKRKMTQTKPIDSNFLMTKISAKF